VKGESVLLNKVLFAFGGTPKLGGTEAVMMNIFQNIDKSKFKIDFLFYGVKEDDHSKFTIDVKNNGADVFYVPVLREGIIANHKAIRDILRNNHYDIIHAHMDASSTDLLRIAKEMGVKVRIAHSHNTAHLQNASSIKDRIHKIYLDFTKMMLPKYATHFIGCSDAAGLWLFGEKICSQNNYFIFKNAIDVSKYEYNIDIRNKIRRDYNLQNFKVICNIGRLSYQKNHPFLLSVFKEVHIRDENTRLILIGEGEDREKIESLIHELSLDESVIMTGNVLNVNEILQGVDLFFMPSFYEGLSIAIVEAQASGLKCIASDTVTSQTNISGNVKFLSLEASVDKWAETIISELNSGEERISPIKRIRDSGFDMISNIKNLEVFYNNALKL